MELKPVVRAVVAAGALFLGGCLLISGELHHEDLNRATGERLVVKKWGVHYDFRVRVLYSSKAGERVVWDGKGTNWAPEFTKVLWSAEGAELFLCNEYGKPLRGFVRGNGAGFEVRERASEAMVEAIRKEYGERVQGGDAEKWACEFEGRVAYYERHPRE